MFRFWDQEESVRINEDKYVVASSCISLLQAEDASNKMYELQ